MRSFPGMNAIAARDRAAFSSLFFAEHYFPGSRLIQRGKAAARARAIDAMKDNPPGMARAVERLARWSPKDFRRRYLRDGIPVLFRGAAADWPLGKGWTFAKLTERFGSETIKLVQRRGVADESEVVEGREFSEEVEFGAFLREVQQGGPRYMRFSPLLERFPALLDDFDHHFFENMAHTRRLTYQMFIGGSGSFTPLHNAMTCFFFVNVCGTKRWTLVSNHYLPILNPPPDGYGYMHSGAKLDRMNADEFPGLDGVDRFEVVMEPGDVLFVPSWMWHTVKNDSPTIGIRCGFVYPRGMVSESLTLSSIRILAARNPSTFEALWYTLVRGNTSERDKWLLTARLIRR